VPDPVQQEFKAYAAKLHTLSLEALDRSAQQVVRSENASVAKLITHLAEMAERKTALEMGFGSLYEYCVRRLNLSEGAVPARVHVANVSRRFPQVLTAIASGRLSLTVASLLAAHLSESNVDKLISDCAGKTRKRTEEYLVALRPKPVFAPSIRQRPAPPPAVPETSALNPLTGAKHSAPIVQPARTDVFNFRFSAGRDFRDKFERLAQVLGIERAERHVAAIVEAAVDVALEKKDPKKRIERRRHREENAGSKSRSNETSQSRQRAPSRHIAAAVVERVFERGEYRCEYRAPDGRRCASTTGLQVDHTKPFAIYRSHEEGALRLLCPAHNRYAAERVYGAAFMKRKIGVSRVRAP